MEDHLRNELIKCMKILHDRGLVSGIGGNASVKISKNEILITPTGVFKADLRAEDIVKIDINGNVIEGCLKPSIELPLHLSIYKSRSDVNAIIHAHNPYTIGIISAGKKIEPINYEAWRIFKDIPIIEFKPPGSKELADLVAKNIKSKSAVIMKNHGVIAVGSNLKEALYIIEALEEISIMIFVASCLGKITTIPEEYLR
jgi:L-fuculose-phosphate aldolase